MIPAENPLLSQLETASVRLTGLKDKNDKLRAELTRTIKEHGKLSVDPVLPDRLDTFFYRFGKVCDKNPMLESYHNDDDPNIIDTAEFARLHLRVVRNGVKDSMLDILQKLYELDPKQFATFVVTNNVMTALSTNATPTATVFAVPSSPIAGMPTVSAFAIPSSPIGDMPVVQLLPESPVPLVPLLNATPLSTNIEEHNIPSSSMRNLVKKAIIDTIKEAVQRSDEALFCDTNGLVSMWQVHHAMAQRLEVNGISFLKAIQYLHSKLTIPDLVVHDMVGSGGKVYDFVFFTAVNFDVKDPSSENHAAINGIAFFRRDFVRNTGRNSPEDMCAPRLRHSKEFWEALQLSVPAICVDDAYGQCLLWNGKTGRYATEVTERLDSAMIKKHELEFVKYVNSLRRS